MDPLPPEELKRIARLRGIRYRALKDPDPLVVRTSMAKTFPVPQQTVFDSFADPVAHVRLFSIIKGSTKAISKGIEPLLRPNQFLAFEHVQESNLPPRLMLLKYTLEPPRRILKEGVTDPFLPDDMTPMDKKRAKVIMEFSSVAEEETEIKTTSSFQVSTGAVFSRGFIDRVWLNFFERMMVANGMLKKRDMAT
jgi:hypothetical protein